MDKWLGHSTPSDDHDVLRRFASSLKQCDTAIEVGCWVGMTTLVLAELFQRVYVVDTFEGNPEDHLGVTASSMGKNAVFAQFIENVKPYADKVHPRVCESVKAAGLMTEQADLIFIDANHEYGNVKADIQAWWPHVVQGGILCGHDYHSHGGVRQAVEEFGKDGVMANVWYRVKS